MIQRAAGSPNSANSALSELLRGSLDTIDFINQLDEIDSLNCNNYINSDASSLASRAAGQQQLDGGDWRAPQSLAGSSPSHTNEHSQAGSMVKIIDIQRRNKSTWRTTTTTTTATNQSNDSSEQSPLANNNETLNRRGRTGGPSATTLSPSSTSTSQAQATWAKQTSSSNNNSASPNRNHQFAQKQQSGETLSSFESDYDLLVYLGETETEDIVDTERSCDYQDQTWRQSICGGASLAPTIDESLSELLSSPHNNNNNPNQQQSHNSSQFATPILDSSTLELPFDSPAGTLNRANWQQQQQQAQAATLHKLKPPSAAASQNYSSLSLPRANNNNQSAVRQQQRAAWLPQESYENYINQRLAPGRQQGGNKSISRQDNNNNYNDSDCDHEVSLAFNRPQQQQLTTSLGSSSNQQSAHSAQGQSLAGNLGKKVVSLFNRKHPQRQLSTEQSDLHAEQSVQTMAPQRPQTKFVTTTSTSNDAAELDRLLAEMSQSLDLDSLARYDPYPNKQTRGSPPQNRPIRSSAATQVVERPKLNSQAKQSRLISNDSVLDEYDGASRMLEQMISGHLEGQTNKRDYPSPPSYAHKQHRQVSGDTKRTSPSSVKQPNRGSNNDDSGDRKLSTCSSSAATATEASVVPNTKYIDIVKVDEYQRPLVRPSDTNADRNQSIWARTRQQVDNQPTTRQDEAKSTTSSQVGQTQPRGRPPAESKSKTRPQDVAEQASRQQKSHLSPVKDDTDTSSAGSSSRLPPPPPARDYDDDDETQVVHRVEAVELPDWDERGNSRHKKQMIDKMKRRTMSSMRSMRDKFNDLMSPNDHHQTSSARSQLDEHSEPRPPKRSSSIGSRQSVKLDCDTSDPADRLRISPADRESGGVDQRHSRRRERRAPPCETTDSSHQAGKSFGQQWRERLSRSKSRFSNFLRPISLGRRRAQSTPDEQRHLDKQAVNQNLLFQPSDIARNTLAEQPKEETRQRNSSSSSLSQLSGLEATKSNSNKFISRHNRPSKEAQLHDGSRASSLTRLKRLSESFKLKSGDKRRDDDDPDLELLKVTSQPAEQSGSRGPPSPIVAAAAARAKRRRNKSARRSNKSSASSADGELRMTPKLPTTDDYFGASAPLKATSTSPEEEAAEATGSQTQAAHLRVEMGPHMHKAIVNSTSSSDDNDKHLKRPSRRKAPNRSQSLKSMRNKSPLARPAGKQREPSALSKDDKSNQKAVSFSNLPSSIKNQRRPFSSQMNTFRPGSACEAHDRPAAVDGVDETSSRPRPSTSLAITSSERPSDGRNITPINLTANQAQPADGERLKPPAAEDRAASKSPIRERGAALIEDIRAKYDRFASKWGSPSSSSRRPPDSGTPPTAERPTRPPRRRRRTARGDSADDNDGGDYDNTDAIAHRRSKSLASRPLAAGEPSDVRDERNPFNRDDSRDDLHEPGANRLIIAQPSSPPPSLTTLERDLEGQADGASKRQRSKSKLTSLANQLKSSAASFFQPPASSTGRTNAGRPADAAQQQVSHRARGKTNATDRHLSMKNLDEPEELCQWRPVIATTSNLGRSSLGASLRLAPKAEPGQERPPSSPTGRPTDSNNNNNSNHRDEQQDKARNKLPQMHLAHSNNHSIDTDSTWESASDDERGQEDAPDGGAAKADHDHQAAAAAARRLGGVPKLNKATERSGGAPAAAADGESAGDGPADWRRNAIGSSACKANEPRQEQQRQQPWRRRRQQVDSQEQQQVELRRLAADKPRMRRGDDELNADSNPTEQPRRRIAIGDRETQDAAKEVERARAETAKYENNNNERGAVAADAESRKAASNESTGPAGTKVARTSKRSQVGGLAEAGEDYPETTTPRPTAGAHKAAPAREQDKLSKNKVYSNSAAAAAATAASRADGSLSSAAQAAPSDDDSNRPLEQRVSPRGVEQTKTTTATSEDEGEINPLEYSKVSPSGATTQASAGQRANQADHRSDARQADESSARFANSQFRFNSNLPSPTQVLKLTGEREAEAPSAPVSGQMREQTKKTSDWAAGPVVGKRAADQGAQVRREIDSADIEFLKSTSHLKKQSAPSAPAVERPQRLSVENHHKATRRSDENNLAREAESPTNQAADQEDDECSSQNRLSIYDNVDLNHRQQECRSAAVEHSTSQGSQQPASQAPQTNDEWSVDTTESPASAKTPVMSPVRQMVANFTNGSLANDSQTKESQLRQQQRPEVPRRPERKLVAMTSIIQEPEDELMNVQHQPSVIGAPSSQPSQQPAPAIAAQATSSQAQVTSAKLLKSRRDSGLSLFASDDVLGASNANSDSDSSLAYGPPTTSVSRRRRLASKLDPAASTDAKENRRPPDLPVSSSIKRQQQQFAGSPTTTQAVGARRPPAFRGPVGGSLVRRLARNFDQSAVAGKQPTAESPAASRPPVSPKSSQTAAWALKRVASADEEPKSDSTWYDAKSVELLDEGEIAELLREFDDDGGQPTTAARPASECDSLSTGAYVSVAESTLSGARNDRAADGELDCPNAQRDCEDDDEDATLDDENTLNEDGDDEQEELEEDDCSLNEVGDVEEEVSESVYASAASDQHRVAKGNCSKPSESCEPVAPASGEAQSTSTSCDQQTTVRASNQEAAAAPRAPPHADDKASGESRLRVAAATTTSGDAAGAGPSELVVRQSAAWLSRRDEPRATEKQSETMRTTSLVDGGQSPGPSEKCPQEVGGAPTGDDQRPQTDINRSNHLHHDQPPPPPPTTTATTTSTTQTSDAPADPQRRLSTATLDSAEQDFCFDDQSSTLTDPRDDQISLSSSSMSSESLPEVRQRQNLQKLYHIVNEIYSSEAKFVGTLSLLNDHFRQHITNKAIAAAVVQSSQPSASGSQRVNIERLLQLPPYDCVSAMLKHLPQLKALNENLLGELRRARDDWPKTQKVSHVLVKIGPFLKHYSSYIREFEAMQQHYLENLRKYPQFAGEVREFEASAACQKLSIQHHLLKPIQRIPQYRLLLQQYLHHLKPDDLDYEDTVSALEVVSQVAEHANQSMNEGVNFAKLLALQAKIVGKQRDIVQPGRSFVREGELMKVCRKQIQPRWFVLLSDALLYLTQIQASDVLYLNYELPLDDCQVALPGEATKGAEPVAAAAETADGQQQEQQDREFSICSTVRSFSLIARSRQERDDWVRLLRQTIDEHVARRRSFAVKSQQEQPDAAQAAEAQVEQLLGRKAPLWTPDSRVARCQLCTSNFSALFRRHHCRACGRVVCSACSSNKAPLIYLKCRAARVCDECFGSLRANIHLYYLPASHNVFASDQVDKRELKRLDEYFKTLLKGHFVRHVGHLHKPERARKHNLESSD